MAIMAAGNAIVSTGGFDLFILYFPIGKTAELLYDRSLGSEFSAAYQQALADAMRASPNFAAYFSPKLERLSSARKAMLNEVISACPENTNM